MVNTLTFAVGFEISTSPVLPITIIRESKTSKHKVMYIFIRIIIKLLTQNYHQLFMY